jgi:hypothetical protein
MSVGIEVEILFISLQRIKRPACRQAGCNVEPELKLDIASTANRPNKKIPKLIGL